MSAIKTQYHDHLNATDGRFEDDHYDSLHLDDLPRMTRPVLPVECEATPSLWHRVRDRIVANGFTTSRPILSGPNPTWTTYYGFGHSIAFAKENATTIIVQVTNLETRFATRHTVTTEEEIEAIIGGIGSLDRVREVA